MANLKNILFGTALAGGLVFGAPACSSMNKEEKESNKQKTEAEATPVSQDTTVSGHNVALFDSCRSDIKFALALCENYYPYIYWMPNPTHGVLRFRTLLQNRNDVPHLQNDIRCRFRCSLQKYPLKATDVFPLSSDNIQYFLSYVLP